MSNHVISTTFIFNDKDGSKFIKSLKQINKSFKEFEKSIKKFNKNDLSKSIRQAFSGVKKVRTPIKITLKSLIKDISKDMIKEIKNSLNKMTKSMTKEINKSLKSITTNAIVYTKEMKSKISKTMYYGSNKERKNAKKYWNTIFKAHINGIDNGSKEALKELKEYYKKIEKLEKDKLKQRAITGKLWDSNFKKSLSSLSGNNTSKELIKLNQHYKKEEEKTLKKQIINNVKNARKKYQIKEKEYKKEQQLLRKQQKEEEKTLKKQIINNIKNAKKNYQIKEKEYKKEQQLLRKQQKEDYINTKKLQLLKSNVFSNFNNSMSNIFKTGTDVIINFGNAIKTTIKYLTIFGSVVSGVTVTVFGSYLSSIISATEKMRAYNIGLLGFMKTQTDVNKLMEKSLKITEEMPIAFDQVYQSTKAFALIGPVRKMLEDSTKTEEVLKRMFKITLALSQIEPEWGMQGAIFSLREALSGDLRSLQRRFEIPVNLIYGEDGRNIRMLKNDPEAMSKALSRYMNEFYSDKTLKMSANQFHAIEAKIKGVFVKLQSDIGESGIYNKITKDLKSFYTWLKKLSNDKAFEDVTRKIGEMFNAFYDLLRLPMGKLSNWLKHPENINNIIKTIINGFNTIKNLMLDNRVWKKINSYFNETKKVSISFIKGMIDGFKDMKKILDNILNIFSKNIDKEKARYGGRGFIWALFFGTGNIVNLILSTFQTLLLSMNLMLTSSFKTSIVALSEMLAPIIASIGSVYTYYTALKGNIIKRNLINPEEQKLENYKKSLNISKKYFNSLMKNNKDILPRTKDFLSSHNIVKQVSRIDSNEKLYNLIMNNNKALTAFVNILKNTKLNNTRWSNDEYASRIVNGYGMSGKIASQQSKLAKLNNIADKIMGGNFIYDFTTSIDKLKNYIPNGNDLKNSFDSIINTASNAIKGFNTSVEKFSESVKINALKTANLKDLNKNTLNYIKELQSFLNKNGYDFIVTSGYRKYDIRNGKRVLSSHSDKNTFDFQVLRNGKKLSTKDFDNLAILLKTFKEKTPTNKMLIEFRDGKSNININTFKKLGFELGKNKMSKTSSGYPVIHTRIGNEASFWELLKNSYQKAKLEPPKLSKYKTITDKYADYITKMKLDFGFYNKEEQSTLSSLQNMNTTKLNAFIKTISSNQNGVGTVIGPNIEKYLQGQRSNILRKLNEAMKEAEKIDIKKAVGNAKKFKLLMDKFNVNTDKINKFYDEALRKNYEAFIEKYKESLDFSSFKFIDKNVKYKNMLQNTYQKTRQKILEELLDVSFIENNLSIKNSSIYVQKVFDAVKEIQNRLIEGSVKTFKEGIDIYLKQNKTKLNNKQFLALKKDLTRLNQDSHVLFDNIKNYLKFINEQKKLKDKIDSLNISNLNTFNTLYKEVMTKGTKENKQSLESKYKQLLPYSNQSYGDIMRYAIGFQKSQNKSPQEIAYDFAVSLNNDLESIFEQGFFDMLKNGFKNFGDFVNNIFNGITNNVAKLISRQFAQFSTNVVMDALFGTSAKNGNIFEALFSNGGIFPSNNGIKTQGVVNAVGKMVTVGGNGISNKSIFGGLLASKSGIFKTASSYLKRGLNWIKSNPLQSLGIGFGISKLFGKGGLFGSTVDHTQKEKAIYGNYMQQWQGYMDRRLTDSSKYLYQDTTDLSNYVFRTPYYWTTHSGNGITSKKTKSGNVSITAFYMSIKEYMDILMKAGKSHYEKMRELDKMRSQYERKYIQEEIFYKEKYLRMIKAEYEVAKSKNQFDKMDDLRDKILEAENDISIYTEDLKKAIREHYYTVKDYNSWLSNNMGDNIQYQKTLLDIQKQRLDELQVGEDSWYQAQKDYLTAKRTYTENLMKIQKDNENAIGNSIKSILPLTYTRNGINNIGNNSIIQDTLLINKLRSGNYTNKDISRLTDFQTIKTVTQGVNGDIIKTVSIPIKSIEEMITELQDEINNNLTSKQTYTTLMNNVSNINKLLKFANPVDYNKIDYGNLINSRKYILNNNYLTDLQKTQYSDEYAVQISNMANNMANDINQMAMSGLIDINSDLVQSFKDAINNNDYLAKDTIADIYDNIKQTFTKNKFTSDILSLYKNDENWDIFKTVANDKALQSDYIQNYLKDLESKQNGVAFNSLTGKTNIFETDPYTAWYNNEKTRLMELLNEQEKGSQSWADTLTELFQLITDNAKRAKDKAEEMNDALNDSLDKIQKTLEMRVAEENISNKGDIVYVDINNRDSRALLDDMINRLDTSDPKAQELINAFKQKLIGVI